MDYLNVPKSIATVVSSRHASLHELDTVYGLQDLWELLEIITVDSHNANVANTPKD